MSVNGFNINGTVHRYNYSALDSISVQRGEINDASFCDLAPVYSSSNTYRVGDYVFYNNALYRCTTDISTAEDWTAAHWSQVVLSSDIIDLKSACEYTQKDIHIHILNWTKGYIRPSGTGGTGGSNRMAYTPDYYYTDCISELFVPNYFQASDEDQYDTTITYYDTDGTTIAQVVIGDSLRMPIFPGLKFRITVSVDNTKTIDLEKCHDVYFTSKQDLMNTTQSNSMFMASGYCYYPYFTDGSELVWASANNNGARELSNTGTRLTTKTKNIFDSQTTLYVDSAHANQTWVAWYDDADSISYRSYTYLDVNHEVTIPANTYFRIIVGGNTASERLTLDAVNAVYKKEALTSVQVAPIARSEYLNVMTWNVGAFFNGSTAGVPNDLLNSYIIRWHKLLGKFNPDILITQEAGLYFDRNNTITPYDAVLKHKFPYYYRTSTGSLMIASKFPILNPTSLSFESGSNRPLMKFEIQYDENVYLTIVDAHLSIEASSSGIRQDDLEEVRDMVNGVHAYNNCICTGDFNTYSINEFDILTDGGCKIANHGNFGDFETWPHDSGNWNKCIDQIVINPNFDIEYVDCGDASDTVGSEPLSDHAPLFAKIWIRA